MSTVYCKWRDDTLNALEGSLVGAGFIPTFATELTTEVKHMLDEAHAFGYEPDLEGIAAHTPELVDTVATDYGIDTILEQNDINPAIVLNWLVLQGLVDMEDYTGAAIDDD